MTMKKPLISIVVAISEGNRAIGKDNKLPWHIPEDLKRFKNITSGHPIIMGRKTFESIGRPLPNRTNIIITRDPSYQAENCVVVSSIEEAIQVATSYDNDEIFIIGGGEIFKQALPFVDKLYLTVVKGNIQGDVFFPDYSSFSKTVKQESHSSNGYTYTFIDLLRS